MIYFVKNLRDIFQYNLFRSILTGLGVFIGIAAVIIILTISNSFAGNLVNQYMNESTIGLISSAESAVDTESLMNESQIKNKLEEVRRLPGVKEFSSAFHEETADIFIERSNRVKENIVVEFKDVDVTEGISFEMRSGNVAIIRDNEEFTADYTIGDLIYVNNESYEIIGITDETGETNPGIYFPESLREKIHVNKSSANDVFHLVIEDGYNLEDVRDQVLKLMNEGLDNDVKFIDFTEETAKAIKESIGSVGLFLALIGTISLIVAGINVINIMYISTLEKMDEVAIYRALGMRKRTVIILFLMEAFVLVVVFAIVGYLFGILAVAIILVIMDIPIVFSLWHLLLVFFISLILGIGAGIKPAINAANADPAVLLR